MSLQEAKIVCRSPLNFSDAQLGLASVLGAASWDLWQSLRWKLAFFFVTQDSLEVTLQVKLLSLGLGLPRGEGFEMP